MHYLKPEVRVFRYTLFLVFLGQNLARGQEVGIDSIADRTAQKFMAVERNVNENLNNNFEKANAFIDSLNNSSISSGTYKSRVDSIYKWVSSRNSLAIYGKSDSLNEEFKRRFQHIQNVLLKKKTRLDSLLTGYEDKLPVTDDIKNKLKAKIHADELKIPEVSNPLRLPGALGVPDITLPDLDIPEIADNFAMPQLTLPAEIQSFKIPDGDLTSLNIDEIAGRNLMKLDEIKSVTDASGSINGLTKTVKDLTITMKNSPGVGGEIQTQTKQKFVDYFSGHEDKIESEIASMEKLQRKYYSVTDVRYLPRRRTNPEKEKPFIERLILGTSFQIDRSDAKWTGVDISPYLGYRFSDRFRACLGTTYRVTVDVKTLEFSQQNKVFGYRTFGDYKIFQGWYGHLEFEALNTKIPYHAKNLKQQNPDAAKWVPMAYAGLFKSFGLGRNLQGQTQILYDFLDVSKNFNFNKVAFRFGFEYKFFKRKKQQ
ncbi:MAG TPA: hypothetical protein VFW11_17395 [Cyclobacteriaceae bacterium]|nr:hypothetical protein [Cyclobacteriaceae bacterium]